MSEQFPWIQIGAGINGQTLVHGTSMYQMRAELDAGSRMPAHQHPQEQIVHVLEGRMRLVVSGVVHEMKIGDSFYLASNILHAVETIENTLVLDTFSPPRGDYLLLDETARGKAGKP